MLKFRFWGFLVLLASIFPPLAFAEGESIGNPYLPLMKPMPRFFFTWGYNRTAYTRSSIHFEGSGYHFQLHHLIARDRPSTLRSGEYTHLSKFTIPQYNFAIGYHISRRWAVMARMDHMKYVVVNGQKAHMTGRVDSTASPEYAGEWQGETVTVSDDLLTFEHTDGLNYLSVSTRYSLIPDAFWDNKKVHFKPFVGMMAGVVIPKTDVRVFNYGLDNKFHLAGGGLAVEAGAKLTFFRRLFLMGDLRGGFLTLPNVLIHNKAPDRARHHFAFGEATLSLGYQFLGWNNGGNYRRWRRKHTI